MFGCVFVQFASLTLLCILTDSSRNSLSKSVCNAISGLDRRITQCGCFVIFTTLLGALLALTVYYFGIRYEDQKILSDIRKYK